MEDLAYLGLSEQSVRDTMKNEQLTEHLKKITEISKTYSANGITKQQGVLLYHLGSKLKSKCHSESLTLAIKHICNENIRIESQLTAAIEYMASYTVSKISESEFLNVCGAGIEITADQIEDKVSIVVDKYRAELLQERYHFNKGKLMAELKRELPLAEGAMVKKELDLKVLEIIGPKNAEELKPTKKKGQTNEKGKYKTVKKVVENGIIDGNDKSDFGAFTMEDLLRRKSNFHKPGENYKTEDYIVTSKTMGIIRKHLNETGGKVITRFPPEPNGILHIGHAKAININFGYAKAHDGFCNLRFDDTNPEKEEERFFHGIIDTVKWLGYNPTKITHSSDYFDQLYKWALELIAKNLAYVCHQTLEEIRGFNVQPSPWRNRAVSESLLLFNDMRRGKFCEGDATLRLKMTLEEGKRDPVAYRIKFVPHPRTANKWYHWVLGNVPAGGFLPLFRCIYPTYDYTHCLCDSLENVTHSMCTKEFQSRRTSYYQLCNALNAYCPVQWEYGRLNVSYTVVSKRKILTLLNSKVVRDWDDPRLFTLTALRRRGVPPSAINNFVAGLGLTVAQMTIDPHALDARIRAVLNDTAPRRMAVLNPLRVRILNWNGSFPCSLSTCDFPAIAQSSTHDIAFSDVIYIESTDFKALETRCFRRLTPEQSVGLKHVGYVLTIREILMNADNSISELQVDAEKLTDRNKPKAFIHWVADPIKCQVRLYDRLFKHKNPDDPTEVPGGFLSDCNPVGLEHRLFYSFSVYFRIR